jgi:hypothetical protein
MTHIRQGRNPAAGRPPRARGNGPIPPGLGIIAIAARPMASSRIDQARLREKMLSHRNAPLDGVSGVAAHRAGVN